ncbi:MAG TPA: hypothetical protein VGK34_06035, partial [Armatimonadota bacterium]
MRLRTILNRRDGISLIEILVALGVLTIGIMTIVMIFPRGFSILGNSANSTAGGRLAQAEVERIQGGGGVPAGILSGVFMSDGAFKFVDTGFKELNDFYPADQIASPNRDVNKFHYVFEETTQIPAQATKPNLLTDASSYYYVRFSPIDIRKADNKPRISVYGGPLNSVTFPSSLTGFTLGAADYSVDYTNGLLYVQASSTVRTFYVSYTYAYLDTNSNVKLASILCQPVDFPVASSEEQANGYQAMQIALPTDAQSLFAGSVSARRGFKLVSDNAQAWTIGDPYEYKVVDTVRGLIAFNPSGYGLQEMTGAGYKPLTAYISYGVMDWHIIHEDKKVPPPQVPAGVAFDSDSGLNVRLSLGALKRKDYTIEMDQTRFQGLNPNFAETQYDVIVADFDDDKKYTQADTVYDVRDGKTEQAFTVDYKNGILRFSPYFYGHSVRVYYQAVGDWAVAAYRSFGVFQRFARTSTAVPVCLNYGQYYRGS